MHPGFLGQQISKQLPENAIIMGDDGDYLIAGFELLTCVKNNIPVIYIIFNNGEFNVIKKFLLNNFGEYAFMGIKNFDYVKYAEACGAKGWQVRGFTKDDSSDVKYKGTYAGFAEKIPYLKELGITALEFRSKGLTTKFTIF